MNILDQRSKKILWAIIESYISHDGPVGSRTVTRKYSFGLSPATIRNTMADLEEMGYITQPYTSAGRIPTEKGYRLYVDSILKRNSLYENHKLLNRLFLKLRTIEKDINNLTKEASKTLSLFSHYVGLATPPKNEDITLRKIEFIQYNKNKINGILITEEGIVRNKIITIDEPLNQKQLDKITNYLNGELSGLTIGEIKSKIIAHLNEEKKVCDTLILNALDFCRKVIEWEIDTTFYLGEISGTCNLPDFANMKQIKQLFKAIEDKHLMVQLLEKMSFCEGVQVFIGSENVISEIRELSMVASTYNDGRRTLGTIGIIGPTRMNYEKVIPIVSLTAKTLTQILSRR